MWIRSPCKKFKILHQSLQVSKPSRWDCILPCIDLWRLFDKLDFEVPCSIPKWNRRWVWLCHVEILNNVSFWRIRSQNVNICNFSSAENLASLSLQVGATKRHYYQSARHQIVYIEVEYLSNHWSDLNQIWNLSKCDLTTVCTGMQWRWPSKDDDVEIYFK